MFAELQFTPIFPTMNAKLVRIAAILSLGALAACGADEAAADRLSNLKEGMSTAEALSEMGIGPLTAKFSDTMRVVQGFRRNRYLINGVTYEVVYARNEPGDVSEPLLQKRETPVVFRDGKLMGWGWQYYVDEAMGKMQLPTPLRAIDTMTTPVAPPAADSTRPPAADSTPAPAANPSAPGSKS